jgi:hypothetical protein
LRHDEGHARKFKQLIHLLLGVTTLDEMWREDMSCIGNDTPTIFRGKAYLVSTKKMKLIRLGEVARGKRIVSTTTTLKVCLVNRA